MPTKTTASTPPASKPKTKRVVKKLKPQAQAKAAQAAQNQSDDGEHIEVQATTNKWGTWMMSPRDALSVNYLDHEL